MSARYLLIDHDTDYSNTACSVVRAHENSFKKFTAFVKDEQFLKKMVPRSKHHFFSDFALFSDNLSDDIITTHQTLEKLVVKFISESI